FYNYNLFEINYMKISFLIKYLLLILFFIFPYSLYAKKIPNLVGVWSGENIKSSLKKGFVRSNNVVEITEQKSRVFKGFVVHKNGKEEFVGVIKSNHKDFFWADSSDDDGKVIGTILDKKTIETCYLDSGRDAVAGCSILKRVK
ncbi:MAG: hypothetical protein CFH23_00594, partial [Alphaproteobacteria bacterium MarineAlpha6_Bin1]